MLRCCKEEKGKPSMNLLHIVYAKVWGGAEQYIYTLCKEERARGNHNFILIDKNQKEMIAKFQEVATVCPISLYGVSKFFTVPTFLNLLKKRKIDILNCHSGTMLPICAILKTLRPSVKWVVYRHNVTPNRKDFYHKAVQQKADAFVCVSKLVYDLQIQTVHPSFADKFHLICNGIDIERFHKRPRHAPQTPIRIGYAGRMVKNKGILVLLQAIKILNQQENLPCHLYIAASSQTAFTQKCQDFVEKNGLSEFYHLLNDVKDMGKFYDEIDFFVLPTLIKESFGLVLCEAMYSGVPTISTNNGAQGEIIENNVSGILLNPNDAAAIVQSIKNLSADVAKYQQMSLAGCQRVEEKFTIKILTDKLNDLFIKLLKTA